MASLSVNGICRITRDPEIKESHGGAWYTFGIAAYRKNVKEGKQTADFFDAEVYVKKDDTISGKLLRKGALIYINGGYVRNDQFNGMDGSSRNKVKILIVSFDILNDQQLAKPKEEAQIEESIHPSDLPPPIQSSQPKEFPQESDEEERGF